MSEKLGIGWRLVWGLVGGGITAVALVAMAPQLTPPVLIGISVAAGIAIAIVGPILLDVLGGLF